MCVFLYAHAYTYLHECIMLVCIRHAKPSSQDQINKTKEAQETPQESQRPDSAKVKKRRKK